MDAFFVAVELRRRPELRGLPVVVGGTGRRGVVAAASYEARRYGVHSAMPTRDGSPAVPGGGVPARRPRHVLGGQPQVHAHFHAVTPLVEPLALDEAFLDVTGARALLGDGVTIAQRLRGGDPRRARADVLGRRRHRTSSSPSWRRSTPSRGRRRRASGPGAGVFEVRPGGELAYLHPLPVRRLWGVGPATLARLRADGRRHGRRPRRARPAGDHRRARPGPRPAPRRPRQRARRRAGRAGAGGEVDRPRGDVRPRPPRPR